MYTDQSKFKWATVDKVHPRRERSGHVYADLLFEVGGSGQSLLDSAPAMEDDVLVDGSRKALKGLAVVTDPPALGLRSGLHAAFWTAGEPLAKHEGEFTVQDSPPIGMLAATEEFGLEKVGRAAGIKLYASLREYETSVEEEEEGGGPRRSTCRRLSVGQPFCLYNTGAEQRVPSTVDEAYVFIGVTQSPTVKGGIVQSFSGGGGACKLVAIKFKLIDKREEAVEVAVDPDSGKGGRGKGGRGKGGRGKGGKGGDKAKAAPKLTGKEAALAGKEAVFKVAAGGNLEHDATKVQLCFLPLDPVRIRILRDDGEYSLKKVFGTKFADMVQSALDALTLFAPMREYALVRPTSTAIEISGIINLSKMGWDVWPVDKREQQLQAMLTLLMNNIKYKYQNKYSTLTRVSKSVQNDEKMNFDKDVSELVTALKGCLEDLEIFAGYCDLEIFTDWSSTTDIEARLRATYDAAATRLRREVVLEFQDGGALQQLVPGAQAAAATAAAAAAAAKEDRRTRKVSGGGKVDSSPSKETNADPKKGKPPARRGSLGRGRGLGLGDEGEEGSSPALVPPALAGMAALYTPAVTSLTQQLDALNAQLAEQKAEAARELSSLKGQHAKELQSQRTDMQAKITAAEELTKRAEAEVARLGSALEKQQEGMDRQVQSMVDKAITTAGAGRSGEIGQLEKQIASLENMNKQLMQLLAKQPLSS